MNDQIQHGPGMSFPGFVYTKDLIEHAAQVEKFTEAQLRKTERKLRWTRIWAVGATVFLGGTIFALDAAVPMIRIQPVMFWQREDGVVETALTTDSLPAEMADKNIQAWIWQYIEAREGYSWQEIDRRSYIVQAMSAKPVREQYVGYMDPKSADSPARFYGNKAVVFARRGDLVQWQPSINGKPGRMTLHFERQVRWENEAKPKREVWTTTVEWVQDYKRGFKVEDVLMFNPSMIVVTAYPGSHPLAMAEGERAEGRQ